MKLPSQNIVKRSNLVFMEIILFSCSITNQVQEKFEKCPLMVNFVLFSEAAVEDLKDCLEGMLEKDV